MMMAQDIEAQKPSVNAKLKTALVEFSETTSAHGPPKIVAHKYIIAKVFWSLLFITGIAVFTYFSQQLISTYLRYETTTDIELMFDSLEFPAVTVCNLNQFRNDRLPTNIRTMTDEFEKTNLEDLYGGEDEWQYWWDAQYETSTGAPVLSSATDAPTAASTGNSSSVANSTATGNSTVGRNATTAANVTTAGNTTTAANVTAAGNTTTAANVTTVTTTVAANTTTTGNVTSSRRRRRRAVTTLDDERKEVMTGLNGFYVQPDTSEVENMTWFNNVGETSSDKSIVVELTQSLANQSVEELYYTGHEIQEMLQECSFLGQKCGPQDFYWFYDKIYGNCYTYNSGMDGNVAKITSPGATFGLTLTLFINQDQYVPVLSPEAGIRVMLHPQGEVPIIEEDGFNVSPGMKSAVSVKYVEITRLEAERYKNCKKTTGNQNEYYPGNYTLKGCIKTCIQKAIIAACNCASPLYRSPDTVIACNIDEYWCVEIIEEQVLNDGRCDEECPRPCWESQYQYTISTSQWPSNGYMDTLINSLSARSAELKAALKKDNCSSGVHEQLVKLEIYYDNLNYYKYTEKPLMLFEDLVGALGGHLGLWIGMSVISFVEVFELIVILITVCSKALTEKNSAKVVHSNSGR